MSWKPILHKDPKTGFDFWKYKKEKQAQIGYINLDLDEIECKFSYNDKFKESINHQYGIKSIIKDFFLFVYKEKKFNSIDDYDLFDPAQTDDQVKVYPDVLIKDKIIAFPRMPYLLKQYIENNGYDDPIGLYYSPFYGKPTVHPGKGRFYILKWFSGKTNDNFFLLDLEGSYTDRYIKTFNEYKELKDYFPNHWLNFFLLDRNYFGKNYIMLEVFFRTKNVIDNYMKHIDQQIRDMISLLDNYELKANFNLKKYGYDSSKFPNTTKVINIESSDPTSPAINEIALTALFYDKNFKDKRFSFNIKNNLLI